MKHGKRILAVLVATGALGIGIAGPASAVTRTRDHYSASCAAADSNYTQQSGTGSYRSSNNTQNSNSYFIPNYCT